MGQDTIIKYSGEIISAKIMEISPTQIKYKKFNFQDGPLYVENKSDIKMIKYSNGLKEEFAKEKPKITNVTTTGNDDYYGGTATAPANSTNKIEAFGSHYRVQGRMISERNMQKLVMESKDKKIISLVGQAKDAQKMQYIGFAAMPLGIGALYAFSYATGAGGVPFTKTNNSLLALSAVCFVGAIACPVISSIERHKRVNCNHAAVKLYNEKF